ncbi:MAG TPA: arginase family protein [Thermoanaerobaculia bacterium]|jgi:arginase|nr:arginase family protein [Thermoanaerobaculia bacterium]
MRQRGIEVIVVPYDVERDDTPSARSTGQLLSRGLLADVESRGLDVNVSEIPVRRPAAGKAEVVAEIGRNVARAVALAHSQRRFPLVLSGGCLVAVGVVTGLQRTGRELWLVWIDAHGDFNTPESTPSGYWDGMALAAVCGRSLPEVYKSVELRPIHFRNVVHLAGRCFDPPEVEDFERLHLSVVPPAAVGSEECLRLLAEGAEGAGGAAPSRDLYLHIDLDGLDPEDAPAVSYPCPGGPPLSGVLSCFAALKLPAAMTLATASFAGASEEQAARTVDTCRRLLDAFLLRD